MKEPRCCQTQVSRSCCCTHKHTSEACCDNLAKVAKALCEPIVLPDECPPLMERILAAIDQLAMDRATARSAEYDAYVTVEAIVKSVDRLRALLVSCEHSEQGKFRVHITETSYRDLMDALELFRQARIAKARPEEHPDVAILRKNKDLIIAEIRASIDEQIRDALGVDAKGS